ncbi:hypothetical protein BC830DRAFT_371599 [Chytriomyces sp. MP71]|nr:hypothetical protein BC830DRAFT_371599 [Chytriomyces sp. MP71]
MSLSFGCYVTAISLGTPIYTGGDVTVQSCLQRCIAASHSYALIGTTWKDATPIPSTYADFACYCDVELQTHLQTQALDACDLFCSDGNGCGGRAAVGGGTGTNYCVYPVGTGTKPAVTSVVGVGSNVGVNGNGTTATQTQGGVGTGVGAEVGGKGGVGGDANGGGAGGAGANGGGAGGVGANGSSNGGKGGENGGEKGGNSSGNANGGNGGGKDGVDGGGAGRNGTGVGRGGGEGGGTGLATIGTTGKPMSPIGTSGVSVKPGFNPNDPFAGDLAPNTRKSSGALHFQGFFIILSISLLLI